MSVPARPALCLVAALACAAAVSATITPAAHAIELGWGVEGAWYVQDGLIKVLAQEAVDPSSVDPDRISLRISDGGQSTRVPLDGVVAVRDDIEERVVLVYLPPDTWEEVSSSKRAFLTLEYGAFMHIPDGSAVLKSTVLVAMPDQHITVLLVRPAYDHHTDRLYLNFVDAVNVSRADWDGVYLREFRGGASGTAFRPFLGLDPMVAEGDGRTFVLALDARGREILLGIGRLILYTGNDTVASWDHIAAPGKSVWVRAVGKLVSAEYLVDDNRLYLGFTDEIDPFSLHVTRISMADSAVTDLDEWIRHGIRISAGEFVRLSDDRRTIIFEMSASNKYKMSVMFSPKVYVEAGAIRGLDDEREFPPQNMVVEAVGEGFYPDDPDIPAGLLVGRVVYRGDTGELTLRFTEPVDPLLMDASRMAITTRHNCATTLSGQELVGADGDGMWATFQVDAGKNAYLSDMDWISLVLERGAMTSRDGSTTNDAGEIHTRNMGWSPHDAPLVPVLVPEVPCHITYKVDSPAEILERYGRTVVTVYHDDDGKPGAVTTRHYDYDPVFIAEYTETVVMPAVCDGLNAWSVSNPQITFELMTGEGEPIINIKWLEPYNFPPTPENRHRLFAGLAGHGLDPGSHIGVRLLPSERGEPIGYKNIRYIVSHEFGHRLGLEHADYPNIMYSSNPQIPYDDRGYRIPEQHDQDRYC